MNWRAYEMDQNIDKRIAREEGWQEGREEGLQEGREEGREEGWQEGREEGREEGRQEGEYKQLIRQVCKKKEKGISPEDAADQLESDTDQIRRIYDVIDSVGVSGDLDAIYRELSR